MADFQPIFTVIIKIKHFSDLWYTVWKLISNRPEQDIADFFAVPIEERTNTGSVGLG